MIEHSEILATIRSLPTFSQTVVQLAQLLQDEEAGPSEYEAVVQLDVALTANLLRMANSAYFGFSRKISGVREAITLLGARRLFELGAMAAVEAVVPPTLPGYGIDSGAYWCHSVAVAVLAERFAKERKLAVPTLTFTSGLLHDIGKLVISSFLANRLEDLRRSLLAGNKPLLECERDILGGDHAQIGAELARAWNLPEQVVRVIADHHEPWRSERDKADVLVDLVHCADCLSHSLGFGADVGQLQRQVDESAIGRLGLRHIDLEHVASRALPEIEGLAQFGHVKRQAENP
jgi:putative nucleotidyltransferase with HDIG domain